MRDAVNDTKGNKKTIALIVILATVTVLAVVVTVWALFFREVDEVVLTPDYAPLQEESNAEEMSDDGSKMVASEGGGAASIMYQNTVTVDLSDKQATLYFGNPSKSAQDMVVQLVIQDNIILQSGLLRPGNKVTNLDLLQGKEELLEAGGYEGKLRVLYYDPISGEKAMIDTEIAVDITVNE